MHHLFRAAARARGLRAAAAFAIAAALAAPAGASQVVSQNLTTMISKSEIIVSGTVKSVSDGVDKGLPYTQVTLTVKSSAKKPLKAGTEYTFRQFGMLQPRRLADGRYMLPMNIDGMPKWAVGEQVLVFLNPAARSSGLRSPVGMTQGKFVVAGGRVANEYQNRGLFKGVQVTPGRLSAAESAMLAKAGGEVDETTLTRLVVRAVNENWVANGVMR